MNGWQLFVKLIPLLVALACIGWVSWRILAHSGDPGGLVVRWVISAAMMGVIILAGVRSKDNWALPVLLSLVGAAVMTLLWRGKIAEFFGDQFAALYTGGNQEAEPGPFLSTAEARRKQGRYQEAIEEVQAQIAQYPTNFQAWMLLAEIQAGDLKDLPSARETIEQILSQGGHSPKNIAYVLGREADWHLKLAQDRAAARAALERIVQLLPDTEQAQLALQRIAHLTPEEMLAQKQAPRRVALRPGEDNVGLRLEPLDIKPREEDPAETAAQLVKHLEEHPYDSEAREKLALLYAKHYQRLDLATDQLEQLISCPNQPSRQVIQWLNLLADLQVDLAGDTTLARETLRRIVDLYPKTAAAENALSRVALLKLELRPKQATQAVKLGSYDQNIGLNKESRPKWGQE